MGERLPNQFILPCTSMHAISLTGTRLCLASYTHLDLYIQISNPVFVSVTRDRINITRQATLLALFTNVSLDRSIYIVVINRV